MRKAFFFLLTFTLLFSCSASSAIRRDWSLALASAQTTEFKTLKATKEMLVQREASWRTYLVALRIKLAQVTGILNYQQNLEFVKLDSEIGWLVTHKNSLLASNSIEELQKQSAKFEERFPSTELLAYQTLGTILFSKETTIREQTILQSKKINEQLLLMRQKGSNVDTLTDRLIEAQKEISNSQTKQTEAEKILKGLESGSNQKKEVFSRAQNRLFEGHQNLKNAVTLLTEIIDNILKHD